MAFTKQEVSGVGPYPYNFRIINSHVYAGGHPLNPATDFKNTDEQAKTILQKLKSYGVQTVINLENSRAIRSRYKKLLDSEGLKEIHIPLNIVHMPNKDEWKEIITALDGTVFIHCKWGADRTGAVVGRYLVERENYSPDDAYKAVISGGKMAGPMGGLKTSLPYIRLKDFIWYGPDKR